MGNYDSTPIAKSDRIKRLVDHLYAKMPEIEAARAELITESFKATEGKPVVMRKARAFEHILKNLPIIIRPEELIVGSTTIAPRGCQTYPEFSYEWLEAEFETVETRSADPFYISEETKKRLLAADVYWKGKTTSELATSYMAPETLRAMKHNFFTPGNYFYNGVGHVTVQYETVLAIGLNGVKEKVRKEMENCHFGDADYSIKMCFLESILISCDAVITYANRYAKMAEEMAEKETDAARRQELLTIARVCKNVPEFPAESFQEAAVGDFILYQSDSKAYRYMITEMDKKNNIFKVVDSTDKDAEPITVEVKKYIPKVVITIGYVGYLLTATESIEGLIILGLAVLFLIILYIVAELLKKEPQDDYDDTDTEPGYVKSKKELKKEEKAREKRYKEEERQIKKEERARKKGKAPERKKIKTGGFVDEIYEDDLEPTQPEQPTAVQAATSEAHELLKKEIAAATADEQLKTEKPVQPVVQQPQAQREVISGKTEVIVPQVKEQLKQMMSASDRKPVEKEEEADEEKPVEIKRMVIPSWSAAQIAESAKNQGDAPDIVRDDVTKVTLFDYSDIIADEKPVRAEGQTLEK